MSHTLTYSGTTVTLPDDILWPDEFGWSPVDQSTERSVGGQLVIDVAARVGGRQITLQSGADYGWTTRSTVSQLEAWRALAGAQMALLFRGVTRTVVFDHERGAIESEPITDFSDPSPADPCAITLRFIDVT